MQSLPFTSFRGGGSFYLSATGEAGIDFVPERDLCFPQPPAQVDLVIVHPTRKIDQTGVIVLQEDAELLQLLFVVAEALLFALEFLAGVILFFAVRFGGCAL